MNSARPAPLQLGNQPAPLHSERGTKRRPWSPWHIASHNSSLGDISEDPPSISQQAPQLQRPDLCGLIQALDTKLCSRFDLLESRLENIAGQIANHGLWPASPASPASEVVQSPDEIRSRCAPSADVDFYTNGDTAEKKPDGSLEIAVPDGDFPRQVSGESNPNTYHLRGEWQWDRKALKKHMKAEDQRKTLDCAELFESWSGLDHETADKHWWILWPSSKTRLVWDITTMLVIAYDMATIPVHLAFAEGEDEISKAIFLACLAFWTLDILLSFMTGFYSDGKAHQVETSPLLIAKNYILTWFVPDVALVASGWTEVFLEIDSPPYGLSRVTKTLRILRIMRSMRLLRLAKVRRMLDDIQDRITSEYFHILMSVCRLSVVVVWTNHFIACGWWALGSSGPSEGDVDAERSWTSHFGFQSAQMPYQYFTALHWSLTQFTPASMEITPRNELERIFAVMVLMFAMIVFSSFVSSITAAMTRLRSLNSVTTMNFVMLRRYLRVRGTPQDLTLRIVRCVDHRYSAQKEEIHESSVPLLQLMSQPLMMELRSHMYDPFLKRHPFFQRYGDADPVALQQVCLVAVQLHSLSTGDALFTEAGNGDQIFFVRKGRFQYFPMRCRTPSKAAVQYHSEGMGPTASVDSMSSFASASSMSHSMSRGGTIHPAKEMLRSEGDYFCENSLWCPWQHTGTMIAVEMTEVLAVEAAALARVTQSRGLVVRGTHRYAVAYVDQLNSLTDQVTDIRTFSLGDIEDLAQQAFRKRGKEPSCAETRDGDRQPSANVEECCTPQSKVSATL